MLRVGTALVLIAAFALAQSAGRPSVDEQLASAGPLLERGRTGEYERLLRQLIPKPEEEPAADLGIFSSAGGHDVLWALAGYSYLAANDYANAERLSGERLRAAEARGPTAAGHVPIFLTLLAETYRLQGKYAVAFPLYERLYRLWLDNQLPADFQKASERGYLECLLVRGEGATAEIASVPAVNPDGSAVGPSFHEDMFNTHAVAMEEAGHQVAAVKFESEIDTQSRRPQAANQQDRDLLRARLLSARGQKAAAEAIYRKWSDYWKNASPPPAFDPKEFLQIRTAALIAYGHFLAAQGRPREAQAIHAQLAAAGCKFGTCEQ